MMTKSVLTQVANLMDSTKTSSSKSRSSENPDVSFGSIMNQNANKMNTSKSDIDISSKKQNVSKKYENDDSSMDTTTQKAVSNPSQSTDSVRKEETKVTTEKEAADNQKVAQDEIKPEVIAQALNQMQTMIIHTVTEVLGISEDELNSFMEELNLQPVDLLEPANVMQLMMQVNGMEEPMQLLTDDNLSNQLKELTSILDQLELPEEFGITKDQMITAMEAMTKEMDFDKVMSDVMDDVPVMVESKAKAEPNILVEKSTSKDQDLQPTTTEIDSTTQSTEKITTTATQTTSEGSTGGQKESRGSKSQEQQTPAETFVQNLVVKGQTQTMNVEATAQRIETMRNIVEQVVEQIKVSIKPEATSMELQLNPENLGKINLSVASKDGQLTATITTQTEVAKQALESQIQNLRDNLSNQGLKVEAVEVNVSSFGFSDNQNNQMTSSEDQKKNQGNRRKIDLSEFDEFAADVTEDEILAAKVMEQNGGNVDYIA